MEYVNPFLIGGSVIAGSKIAANMAGPALAPIVGGMPTGIIASFFLKSQLVFRSSNNERKPSVSVYKSPLRCGKALMKCK